MASGFHPERQSFELSTTTYAIADEPTTQPHIPPSPNDIHMSEHAHEPARDSASEATTPPTNPAPHPPTGDATTSTPDDGPTQRSLQQASLALELALSRIVEVRRSLLQLAQGMPRGTPSDAAQDSDEPGLNLRGSAGVGPAHDAILLAGDAAPDGGQWSAGRARRRRAQYHPQPQNWDNMAEAIVAPSSQSPASEAAARLGQRYEEMYAALISADPAATTRGLRVAAREAHADGPPPLEAAAPGADFVLTQVYDEIRGVMSLGLRPPPPPPPASVPRAPLTPAWRASDARRWRARGGAMPLAPLPAPPPGAGAEGPPRLPSFADFIGTPPPVPGTGPMEGGAAARFAERYRMYQDARQAGDDDAALDWADDDFFAWLFPAPGAPPLAAHLVGPSVSAGGSTVRVTRTTETQVSPADRPAGPGARRRGWGTSPPRVRYADSVLTPAPAARLDADGNEVPPDEEREIERARTEHRMRSAHPRRMPGGVVGAGAAMSYPGMRQYFGRAPDTLRAVQPLVDAEPSYDDGAAEAGVVALPMYVDPLPMPLATMVADAQRPVDGGGADARKAVAVPPHACLAGR
ncbi:hypothetical protein HYPSUDRAFT_196718 [Hypholoma sublateritium FD-334 SS-4]|uniref:Uncharacterized protein n=1 Tax=Hypholoma sublateritium (strain FD-334 SS-4) TaxID=945553 RepID=A0A0D2LMR6_HYPSF|nr:hypothetical protein HYPSUDRAFT_196718 [Hypholoma sublateritium FD-334 SS-4]